MQTILCYSYIYDMNLITVIKIKHKLHTASQSAPLPPPSTFKAKYSGYAPVTNSNTAVCCDQPADRFLIRVNKISNSNAAARQHPLLHSHPLAVTCNFLPHVLHSFPSTGVIPQPVGFVSIETGRCCHRFGYILRTQQVLGCQCQP